MEDEPVQSAQNPNHTYLLQLWSNLLNSPNLGISDDFFAAGGSSMQIIEMLMVVCEKYSKEIDYAEFFRKPCVQTLSDLVGN